MKLDTHAMFTDFRSARTSGRWAEAHRLGTLLQEAGKAVIQTRYGLMMVEEDEAMEHLHAFGENDPEAKILY